MPVQQFEAIMERNWTPVKLVGDALPAWAVGIPESILSSALASGTSTIVNSTPYSSDQIPSGRLIGGFDIYRRAPDDPVELNKDWYAVVIHPSDSTMLLVDGPFKDAEHWLDSIPDRYKDIEVLGVPKKKVHNDEQG